MSEVLGHDANGRPLRVGDELVVVKPFHAENMGVSCQIIGPVTDGYIVDFVVDLWDQHYEAYKHCFGYMVQKRHNDHRPASHSYEHLMTNLKSGDKVQP